MEALETLAYFLGASAIIVAFGFFFKCVDGSGVRSPRGEIDTSPPNGLYLPDRKYPERQMWTYKTKTVEYVPRETKATTGTKGAQPTKDAGPKPETKETS